MGGFWNRSWLTATFLSECAALAALALGGSSLPAPAAVLAVVSFLGAVLPTRPRAQLSGPGAR